MFQKQYRGELLEREILPFKQTPFAAFFNLPDPIAVGLPVAELIERIAERYAQPTNEQLKARLIIAAAFQRALLDWWRRKALRTRCRSAIGFRRSIAFSGLVQTERAAAKKFSSASAPESQGGLRFVCEWLFDEKPLARPGL